MNSLKEVWQAITEYLKDRINIVTYDTWLAGLELVDITGNEATLRIKSEFHKKIIIENYEDLLKEAFLDVMKFHVNVKIITADEAFVAPQMPIKAPHYEYSFETFIVGSSNRFAHAAALAVAETPEIIYNPLYIYGNPGLGKTHLLNAIRSRINEKFPDRVVISLSCEAFVNEFIYSLNNGTINQFREKYRNADYLLVDDIQFISGKESTEVEFFNTFNTLFANNKQIIVTSDRMPRDIASLKERYLSRFEQGLIADIQPPEFETRVAIIRRKAQLINIDLPDEIVFFIADQIKSNIRQLEGVVKKLQAFSLINESISLSSAQIAIRDIRNDNQPEPVTVKKIIEEVSRVYNVSYDDIMSAKHDREVSNARQIAIYIVREITKMTYQKIGKEFSGRDYTTVIYSYRQVEQLIKKKKKKKNRIKDIIQNLENR